MELFFYSISNSAFSAPARILAQLRFLQPQRPLGPRPLAIFWSFPCSPSHQGLGHVLCCVFSRPGHNGISGLSSALGLEIFSALCIPVGCHRKATPRHSWCLWPGAPMSFHPNTEGCSAGDPPTRFLEQVCLSQWTPVVPEKSPLDSLIHCRWHETSSSGIQGLGTGKGCPKATRHT